MIPINIPEKKVLLGPFGNDTLVFSREAFSQYSISSASLLQSEVVKLEKFFLSLNAIK